MLSRIPSGKLTDRIGHKCPIITAFTLLTVAFFTMSETYNIYLLTFALIIYGAAHGMRAVAEWSMLGDCLHLRQGTSPLPIHDVQCRSSLRRGDSWNVIYSSRYPFNIQTWFNNRLFRSYYGHISSTKVEKREYPH
jgi:MFS family permease